MSERNLHRSGDNSQHGHQTRPEQGSGRGKWSDPFPITGFDVTEGGKVRLYLHPDGQKLIKPRKAVRLISDSPNDQPIPEDLREPETHWDDPQWALGHLPDGTPLPGWKETP